MRSTSVDKVAVANYGCTGVAVVEQLTRIWAAGNGVFYSNNDLFALIVDSIRMLMVGFGLGLDIRSSA